jgi:hypothetical protein
MRIVESSNYLAGWMIDTLGLFSRSNQTEHREILPKARISMTSKRLFWLQFWLLWGAGVITSAIVTALVRIPTTPLATLLLLRNHSQRPLLLGVEAIEITVELAIAVSCGLFAAHRVGLGAPILEKRLRGEKIRSQLRSLLVPTFLVGILIALVSMLPSLRVFHPNRQLAHQEAQRISESPDGAKLAEKLGRFVNDRPLSLPSLTVWYMHAAIRGELISGLFLLSVIALIFAKIAGSPSGAASNRVLLSAVLGVAAIGAITHVAWLRVTTAMIVSSLGFTGIVHDSFWLVVARALLQTVPSAVGLGWLYVRHGIESAILGAFVASVVAYLLFVLVVVRLV